MSGPALAALVIEQNDVVRLDLNVVDDDLRATLSESLDDFGGLGARAAGNGRSVGAVRSTAASGNRPRLAICDEDASRVCVWSLRHQQRSDAKENGQHAFHRLSLIKFSRGHCWFYYLGESEMYSERRWESSRRRPRLLLEQMPGLAVPGMFGFREMRRQNDHVAVVYRNRGRNDVPEVQRHDIGCQEIDLVLHIALPGTRIHMTGIASINLLTCAFDLHPVKVAVILRGKVIT